MNTKIVVISSLSGFLVVCLLVFFIFPSIFGLGKNKGEEVPVVEDVLPIEYEAAAVDTMAQAPKEAVPEVVVEEPVEEVVEQVVVVLTPEQVDAGIRELLRQSVTKATKVLSSDDGFYKNQYSHIDLPEALNHVSEVIDDYLEGDVMGDLEIKMNRAAEAASPRVAGYMLLAIDQLKIDDITALRDGEVNVATYYLREKMGGSLARAVLKIIQSEMMNEKVYTAYDSIMETYATIPLEPPVKFDMDAYMAVEVVDKIFNYVGVEEALMRRDEKRRNTDLIRSLLAPH